MTLWNLYFLWLRTRWRGGYYGPGGMSVERSELMYQSQELRNWESVYRASWVQIWARTACLNRACHNIRFVPHCEFTFLHWFIRSEKNPLWYVTYLLILYLYNLRTFLLSELVIAFLGELVYWVQTLWTVELMLWQENCYEPNVILANFPKSRKYCTTSWQVVDHGGFHKPNSLSMRTSMTSPFTNVHRIMNFLL